MNDKLSPYDLMKFMTSNFDDYHYDRTTCQYMVNGCPLDENMVNHLLAYIAHNLDPSITRRRLLVGIKRHGHSPFVYGLEEGLDGVKAYGTERKEALRLIKKHVKPYDSTVRNDSGTLAFVTHDELQILLGWKYKGLDLSTEAIAIVLEEDLGHPYCRRDKEPGGHWLELQGLEDKPETKP